MSDHVKVYGVKPRIQYTANGTSTAYDFPFAIFKTSDINVYFGDVLQSSSLYSVSGEDYSDGGTVTFNTAPAANTIITIVRNLSIERTTDFQEGGALRAEVLNDELDYQIACQQQIADNLNRSMVLPPYATDSGVDLTLPTPIAGKAIVWNADGTNLENSTIAVNELESTLNGYKTAAQTAASTATNQAGIASSQAETATTQAGIATTKANEANFAVNQLNGMRTNCITEIPQKIKLELNSSTLTLKSGSIVIRPNGNQYELTTDCSANFTTDGTYYVMYRLEASSLANWWKVNETGSGSSLPADGTTYKQFFNTTDLNFYLWNGDSNTWQQWYPSNSCMPLAIASVHSGLVSLDKVFNGFGYLGSTVFALPGIKGLIPNGKNSNGTLKNTEFTTTSLLLFSDTSTSDNVYCISDTGIQRISNTNYSYDNAQNILINKYDNSKIEKCAFATGNTTSGFINFINFKTAFQALDYSDKQTLSSWGMADYKKSISLSTSTTSYTATRNGYITFIAKGNNNTAKAFIDNSQVFQTNSQYSNTNTFPIAQGSVFTRSGGSEISAIIFTPCKGG